MLFRDANVSFVGLCYRTAENAEGPFDHRENGVVHLQTGNPDGDRAEDETKGQSTV